VGGRVKLHPAIAFVCGVGGGLVFGALGVFLATPTVGSLRLLLVYIYRKLLDQEPFESTDRGHSGVWIRGLIGGRKIEAIIFDLDGAITQLDWEVAAWAAQPRPWLDWLMPPDHRRTQMRHLMIALEGFINFFISQLQRRNTPLLQRMLPFFNRLRGYPPATALTVQPTVPATLAALATTYQLALVTARTQQELTPFWQSGQLNRKLFTAIVTRNEVRNLLPHSEGLLLLTQQLGLNAEQILIVSDSDVNLRAGRAMGMASAAVLTGLGEKDHMRETDLILDNLEELKEWL
jgi:phosphoglycolate phosphatase